jgi:hypothetical protein
MSQEQGQQQITTIAQKIEIMAALASFPALTLMIFLRRKVGYRFLSPIKVMIVAILLWFIGGLATVAQYSGTARLGWIMFLFAIVFFIVAQAERHFRWRDIKAGIPWHTYSRGVPLLRGFLGLDETAIKRFVDPAAAFLIGLAVSFFVPVLGYWFMFSAVCLYIFEAADYERELGLILDMLDGIVTNETQSWLMGHYDPAQPGSDPQRSLEETAGIPTGIAPDISAQVNRRRNRAPASNLVTPNPPTPPPPSPAQPPSSPIPQVGQQEPATQAQKRRLPPDNLVITGSPLQGEARLSPLPTLVEQEPEIPLIQSPNDPAFLALPSGATFMTPDGQKRWKK